MSSEHPSSILNSELAYDILELLAKKEKGDYGKRIANELGKSQSSVCRILTSLTDIGFVERGERTKAQYYKISHRDIASFWYKSLKQELDDSPQEKDVLENEKEKVIDFGTHFFQSVMNKCNERSITVSELLYNCFIYSVGEKVSEDKEFINRHPFLRPIIEGTVRKLEMQGYPKELESVVKEVE